MSKGFANDFVKREVVLKKASSNVHLQELKVEFRVHHTRNIKLN